MPSRVLCIWAMIVVFWVGADRTFAASVGDAAPPFVLSTADGRTISLEQLRGRIVYLDFWASWCGPCRRSFPWMNEIGKRYVDGVTIVAVNVDAKREDADRFLRQYPAGFTVVYDASGATPRAYDVKAMPSSYLIDREGRIAGIEQGFLDERRDALEDKIRALAVSRR